MMMERCDAGLPRASPSPESQTGQKIFKKTSFLEKFVSQNSSSPKNSPQNQNLFSKSEIMKATTKLNDFRPVRDLGLGGAHWGGGLEEVELVERSKGDEIDGSE